MLEEIYALKKPGDKVILDGAHAHLAHLVVKTSINSANYEHVTEAQEIEAIKQSITKHGIHCEREAGCDVSGGSLGHGLGIGIGMALANPDKNIFVVLTDGSLGEGSVWEALRVREELIFENLIVYVNMNGSTALHEINKEWLIERLGAFTGNISIWKTTNGEGFEGVQGHYKTI